MSFGRPQDGMVTRDVYGRVVRIFNPRWRVWRWARWLFSSAGITTHVAWTVPIKGSRLWRSVGQLEVSAFIVPRQHVSPRAAYIPPHEKPTRPDAE